MIRSCALRILVLAVLSALPARALGAGPAGETPRSMVLELRGGTLRPLVDRGYAADVAPYRRLFGANQMLLGSLAFEYQLFQRFGSFSAGLSLGYAEVSASALETRASADQADRRVAQTASLTLVPAKLYAAYRFDWLALKWRVPLVPYAKAGLVGAYWRSTTGSKTETVSGARGAGTKFGLSGTLGAALLLDVFDPRLARDFDTGMGVNHTYLFAEFTIEELNNFWLQPAKSIDFSSRHWTFGLALEF